MVVLRQFWNDEGGATSIEYGIIGTLISILCVAGATAIGQAMDTKWFGVLASSLH